MAVDRPAALVRSATFSPVGPAPMTMTSYAWVSFMRVLLGIADRGPLAADSGPP